MRHMVHGIFVFSLQKWKYSKVRAKSSQGDIGEALCIRLSGINDPIDSGWYRVALRCSTTDYHFIRQEGSTWYSKSEKLPVFSVTEAEVTGEKWYAILSNSQNSYERYHIDQSYSGPIIYFAIREGWSN